MEYHGSGTPHTKGVMATLVAARSISNVGEGETAPAWTSSPGGLPRLARSKQRCSASRFRKMAKLTYF